MRKVEFAAIALIVTLTFVAQVHRAQAMTPAAPAQLGIAANAADAAQPVAWRCGWHGCVPGWHRYYRSYPYPYPFPYFVLPRIWIQPWPAPGPWYGPGWGWRHPYWGWRYRHWRRRW